MWELARKAGLNGFHVTSRLNERHFFVVLMRHRSLKYESMDTIERFRFDFL